jgi:hypothetical protein
MTTEAQVQANRANAQKSTGLRVRSDRVSEIGVRDGTPAPSAPVPWASAPNKPNFCHGKTKGKWFTGKELWLSGPAKSTGKTKPNLGELGHLGKGGPRMGGDFAGKWNARNEPNSSIADFGLRIGDRPAAGRPLRPPGQGLVVQTNPIPAAGTKRQVLCGKGVMVNHTCNRLRPNKPNLRQPGGEDHRQGRRP